MLVFVLWVGSRRVMQVVELHSRANVVTKKIKGGPDGFIASRVESLCKVPA